MFDQKCRQGNKTQQSWANWDAGYWLTELTLWLYIEKGRLQGIPQNFCYNYPKNSLLLEFSVSICSLATYDPFIVVFMIQSYMTGFENLSVLCALSFYPSQDSLPGLSVISFMVALLQTAFLSFSVIDWSNSFTVSGVLPQTEQWCIL